MDWIAYPPVFGLLSIHQHVLFFLSNFERLGCPCISASNRFLFKSSFLRPRISTNIGYSCFSLFFFWKIKSREEGGKWPLSFFRLKFFQNLIGFPSNFQQNVIISFLNELGDISLRTYSSIITSPCCKSPP